MPWHELGVSWTETGLTAVSATVLYAAVILFSRLAGQRQFSTSSSYDLAFIFALGAIVGRAVLVRTSLLNALVALAVMFTLHVVVNRTHHRFAPFHRLIQNQPILLLVDGEIIDENMDRAHTSSYEVYEAIRLEGLGSPEDVAAVILERNGNFAVIERGRELDREMFEEVVGRQHLG